MLKPYDIAPGSVNILIGPNGSGKSFLLRDWCEELKVSSQAVLAMSPSPYDRFVNMRGWNFKFYGPRQGRKAASNVIRDAILKAYEDDPKILKRVTQILKYAKFDGRVGIRVKNLRLRPAYRGGAMEEVVDKKFTPELHELLQFWQSASDTSGKIDFYLEEYSFDELRRLSFGALFREEKLLRKLKLISKIEYVLYRDGKEIPLMSACSGELSLITGLCFIASHITERTVIAIDEPENSLHPNWQKDYIKMLLDLFHYHQPKILIATHSPIIISGAQLEREKSASVNVFQVEDRDVQRFDDEKLSLEEMYDELFGIITPMNHHLSQSAVRLLNKLNAKELSLSEVDEEIDELISKCYDDHQVEVIKKFKVIAQDIDSKLKGIE